MNRRGFLASVLGGLASVPLIGWLAPAVDLAPRADTLGEGDYHYGFDYARDADGAVGGSITHIHWWIRNHDGSRTMIQPGERVAFRDGRWIAEPVA